MEVEYCTDEEVNVKEIQHFINNLNINVSKELNIGKPELYLKKHKITTK